MGALRTSEQAKIKCGVAHFDALRAGGSKAQALLDPPIRTAADFQSAVAKAAAGKTLGIPLLDHIVLGGNSIDETLPFTSIRTRRPDIFENA